MADDEVLTEENEEPIEGENDEPSIEENDEPTEIEILQEISNDIKYLIKCMIPNSVYVYWDYPTDEGE